MRLMSFTPPEPAPSKPNRLPRGSRTKSVAWIVVVALVCAGGAAGLTAAFYSISATSTASGCSGSPVGGNLTIVDDGGRCVTVPFDPARVAVLSPSIMDTVYRLGLRSHVVAVDCYATSFGGLYDDYSSDQIALWNLSPSMCVQVAPTFSLEDLANATPQVVLASTIISQVAVSEITSTLHIPVVVVQPSSIHGILTDVTLLGEVFGVASAATKLNSQLQSELSNATLVRTTDLSRPSALLTYDVDNNGYWTFGAGTFGSSLVELAGGVSISASNPSPYPELPAETVLADNPSAVVCGVGFGLNLSYYQTAPGWSSLPAVENGAVFGINSNYLTEADPTMILSGLPALLAIFHP